MSESREKTILITGCTSGIGYETARYLHQCGYNLLLAARNVQKLEDISKELDGAAYCVCDFEQQEQIKTIFDFCAEKNIKLDGMVHAAGYAINMPIRSFREEDMIKEMQLHYFAFMELCKCFYNRKISNDGASIVAMSSLAALTKRKASTLYAASKSALNVAVSVAAKEFVKRSIRVNALMPGYVDTRMNKDLDKLIDIKERQPMGLIPPMNIAYIIEFLLSDKSDYITGAMIPVSAGMED